MVFGEDKKNTLDLEILTEDKKFTQMYALTTAAMLYGVVQCAHRPAMQLFGDPAKCDEISLFIHLLRNKGTTFEHELIDGLTPSHATTK